MSELFRVENLFFGYDSKPFLKNISFCVNEGEMVSVIGENGSGKSTLFKAVNGLLKNVEGRVLYKNKNIRQIKQREKAKEIAIIHQNGECNFPFTCFEVASMGLFPHKGQLYSMKKEDVDFVKHIMEITDTIDLAQKTINCLSGGQRQRVLLARALVQKPRLLFLDEAMSGLDVASRIKMTEILNNECKKNGMTVISIQHDINLAFEKSDSIAAMKNGEVYSFGKPKDLLNKNFFREVFNVEVEIYNNKYFRIIL